LVRGANVINSTLRTKIMAKLSRELLGLSGEYAVASELCRRGFYAQLTMGHHKQTDILIESEQQMVRIQVKAKQGLEWPAVSSLYRQEDILVLVDYQNKELDGRPDFYILNLNDWKALIEEEKDRIQGVQIDKSTLTVTYPDGWKGLNIVPVKVNNCRERWDKIILLRATRFNSS
jgi:hypothetical protein